MPRVGGFSLNGRSRIPTKLGDADPARMGPRSRPRQEEGSEEPDSCLAKEKLRDRRSEWPQEEDCRSPRGGEEGQRSQRSQRQCTCLLSSWIPSTRLAPPQPTALVQSHACTQLPESNRPPRHASTPARLRSIIPWLFMIQWVESSLIP